MKTLKINLLKVQNYMVVMNNQSYKWYSESVLPVENRFQYTGYGMPSSFYCELETAIKEQRECDFSTIIKELEISTLDLLNTQPSKYQSAERLKLMAEQNMECIDFLNSNSDLSLKYEEVLICFVVNEAGSLVKDTHVEVYCPTCIKFGENEGSQIMIMKK